MTNTKRIGMILGVLAALLQDGCDGQLGASVQAGASCAAPVDAALPMCGTLPGYVVDLTDCGGRQADGLRCATCTWRARSAEAEIQDAAVINVEPGCTAQGGDGGLVLCVFDCLACR